MDCVECDHGFHRHFMGIALFDVLGTVLIAFWLARWRRWALAPTLLAVFVVGIAAHRVFGVRTVVDKALFTRTS